MSSFSIAAAIPLFFILMAIEYGVLYFRGMRWARFSDGITSLSCGLGFLVFALVPPTLVLALYTFIFEHFAFFVLDETAWTTWVLAIVGVDLGYYAFHRAGHRMNFMWAIHIAHHSSEDYNLTTALRQSWFASFVAWFFYLPLLLVGISPTVILLSRTINTLYQFWIHTEGIRSMGFLETFLSTPSHHRVHHGRNAKYIDKNYGGIFIIWDKLFGTFQKEEEKPVYGIVHPLNSLNPAWANFHYWREMGGLWKAARGLGERFKVIWGPPEWRPSALPPAEPIPELKNVTVKKFDVVLSKSLQVYVTLSLAMVVVGMTVLLYFSNHRQDWRLWASGGVILMTLVGWGAMMEGKRWGHFIDIGKSLLLVPLGFFLVAGFERPALWVALICAVALVSIIWAWRERPKDGVPASSLVSEPAGT